MRFLDDCASEISFALVADLVWPSREGAPMGFMSDDS
jgi:hypothetical protein